MSTETTPDRTDGRAPMRPRPTDDGSPLPQQPFRPVPSAPEHLLPVPDRPIDATRSRTVHLLPTTPSTTGRELGAPLRVPTRPLGTGAAGIVEGVRLTHEQGWHRSGLALGNLLHSLCLAPGEMTRVAMVDWHHEQRGAEQQDTAADDSLSQDLQQNRAISEITTGVASESQHGSSDAESHGSSSTAGASAGFLGFGASAGHGVSNGVTTFVGRSDGTRSISEVANQNVQASAHAQADAARTRRASVVKETSESGGTGATTRIVANYNHGHALTMQYFEVLETYRLDTRVVDAERLLFLPFELLDLHDPAVLHRHRDALRAAATDQAVIDALDALPPDDGTVQVWMNPAAVTSVGQVADNLENAQPDSEHARDDVAVLAELLDAGAPRLTIPGIHAIDGEVFRAPGDLIVAWVAIVPIQGPLSGLGCGGRIELVRPEARPDQLLVMDRVPGGAPLRLRELFNLNVVADGSGVMPDDTTLLQLEVGLLTADGRQLGEPMRLMIRPDGTQPVNVLTVNTNSVVAAQALGDLMAGDRLRYSQAVWSNLDEVTVHGMVDGIAHGGVALADTIVPRPVAVTGNLVGFPWPYDGDERDEARSFRASYVGEASTSSEISVPTGGVFAEAVLGESVSTEPIDPTRFWKWQDSPIPVVPPEIAPVSTDERGSGVATQTGALAPTAAQLPAFMAMPQANGTEALAKALVTSSLFRDMSGMQGAAGVLTEAMRNSEQGAESGASNALEAMKAYQEFVTSMAKEVMPAVTSAMAGPEGAAASETMKGGLAAVKKAEG